MNDDPRPDPTSRLLDDFVRHVSGQVAVPVFTGEPKRTRGRSRRQGLRTAAVVFSALVVAAAVAVALAYGPRSSRIGPHPSPATQPTPGSTSTTSVTSGTQQITYDPFTTAGMNPSLHVTSQVTGTCIRYGRGTTGNVYFRCFATNGGIHDPCFAGPRDTNAPLVCPTSPTSNDVVALTVTAVTSDEPPSPSVIPWAMQLATGQVCLFVSAAWGGLGPYGCDPGPSPQSVADCHTPESSRPWWTAGCQDQGTDASPFTSRDVVTVWF